MTTFLVGGREVEEHQLRSADVYPYIVDEGVIMMVPSGVREPVMLVPELRPHDDEREDGLG